LLTTAGAAVLVVGSIAAVGGTGVAGAATGQPSATTGQTQTQTQTQNLRYLGSVNLRQLAISHAPAAGAGTKIAGPTEIRREPEREGGRGATPPPVRPAPNAANTPVSQGSGGTSSFVGVTGLLQRQADNGNQFSLEPPDQGLCAGGGFIVETVNLAFAVYTDAGQQLTPIVSLNEFYGLGPAIDRSKNPPTFGVFTSDPRCYYDPQTKRWFHTLLAFGQNPFTGDFRAPSEELIAVSQSSDPTGGYSLFSFDTTAPKDPHCPCFGDQPRLGADANGIYISADEYSINANADGNGGRLWAISKRGLVKATDEGASTGVPQTVQVVKVALGGKIMGFPPNAVQPATTPPGAAYASNREYFLSTPDFNGFAAAGGSGANSVVLWALSNTSSLDSATPALHLSRAILPSQPYTAPIKVPQKSGPAPLAASVKEPLNTLQANDDRMQQVIYVGGKVYSSLNTGLGPNGKANRVGAAWFQVSPTFNNGAVGGSVTRQGYVAASGANFIYPAIGLTASGSGAMVGTYSGSSSFPSAAFISFGPNGPTGPILVNGPGARPEDGVTCYEAFLGDLAKAGCRWGDYSAATASDASHVVMATEFIPNTPRSSLMNWGTLVSRLAR
jgi:hypothetical protein